MKRELHPCAYIMTNKNNHVLYTGVTSNLFKRVAQHKGKVRAGFTSSYNVTKLVYYEDLATMKEAIAREKQIKAGSRKKKIDLIEGKNPEWRDLYDDSWPSRPPPRALPRHCEERTLRRSNPSAGT